MKRKAVVLALAVTLTLAASGCNRDAGASSSGSEDAVKVAVVVKTLSNPVWQGVVEGAEAEAKSLGIDVEIDGGTSEDDIQGQIAKIESYISQGVDVLAVAPNGTSQLQPTLQRAADAGIEVVMIDTDIPSFEAKVAHVTSEQEQASSQVAQALVDALGEDIKGAPIGILDLPGNPTVDARIAAGRKVLEDAGAKIVAQLPGKCDRATALASTESMLEANPDLLGIFGACGQNATGAVQAVQNAGMDVKVVGFDGIADEMAQIEAGKMVATVWQDFPAIGAEAVRIGVEASQGESTDSGTVSIPGEIVSEENISEFADKGY